MKKELVKNKCKHNGGKGYWSNLPGFVCLKCGEEAYKCAWCKEVVEEVLKMPNGERICEECSENID